MTIKLFNSLDRKKEDFTPIEEKKVRMYTCGPTVYNFIHVGNARPLVVFDTLRRFFLYRGYEVDYVSNFTDIDDKIINRAHEENTTTEAISEKYIEEFMIDARGLNLYEYETTNPKATEYVQEIIEFVEGLVEKGVAYVIGQDVYFDVSTDEDYGKLSGKHLDELESGARVSVDTRKRNPGDFVLWKGKKEGEPSWSSPWGAGRPGWHIECSVMAKTLLGDTIDIHAGGEDLQFPHHENEIAQSESLTGKPFANYWLHNGMLTVDGTKMSKSLGNFFTVREISEVFDLEVLRFFLLSAHYRSPLNYSYDAMEQASAGLDRLYNTKEHLDKAIDSAPNGAMDDVFITKLTTEEEAFIAAMEDDVNTALATGAIFNIAKEINIYLGEEGATKETLKKAQEIFSDLTKILGILRKERGAASVENEKEIDRLIEERKEARKHKDFARADEIRDELLAMGIVIEDTREGTVWKKI